jgi:hypothetical protein
MNDFSKFLKEKSQERIGDKSLFMPGDFKAQWWGTKIDQWKHEAKTEFNAEEEIPAAEAKLKCPLPQGYRIFLETLGPGLWSDAVWVLPPSDISVFAAAESCRLIVLALGCGFGDIAFDPSSGEDIFVCSNDRRQVPMGEFRYVAAADSFEDFIRTLAQLRLARPEADKVELYSSLGQFQKWKDRMIALEDSSQ